MSTKPLYVFALLFFIISAGTGCGKDKDNNTVYQKFTGTLIKTKTSQQPFGTYVVTYTYDDLGRTLTISDHLGSEHYEYTEQAIIVKTYNTSSNGVPVGITTYNLNAQGMVDNIDEIEFYTYDADGYLLTSTNASNTTTNTYSNGNLATKTHTSGTKYIYQYYANTTNTIGTQNTGYSCGGKQSANLMSSSTQIAGSDTTTFNFAYEYDSQGRVTVEKNADTQEVLEEYTYY